MSVRRRLLSVGLMIGLLATVATPALAAPSVRDFGPAIDNYSRYEGQTSCTSTEQPGVREFRTLLQRTYGANGGGILRSCGRGGKSEHKEGRAYDWMLNAYSSSDRAKADDVLDWLLATDEHGNTHAMARRFGIMYIIWNRKVWSAYRPNAGWQPYSGASPHTDHVHFSFSRAGAARKTSFWTAPPVVEPTAAVAAAPGPFRDVRSDHAFSGQIAWGADTGIIEGRKDGRFLPDDGLTRAQMVALLWRLMDEPDTNSSHGFSDADDSAYYAPALRWAADADVVRGTSSGKFGPGNEVTRGQLATMLHRLVGEPGADGHPFRDVPSELDAAVAFLLKRTITKGTSDTEFSPNEPVTRGQTATFLFRIAGRKLAWSDADAVPSVARFN